MYEGSVQDGKFNGFGRLIGADKAYYIGEFKNGSIHGYGKFYMPDGTI